MADRPAKTPDWLVALRHPTQGDLKLSPYVRAPDHIADVLIAFGPRLPADLRKIVLALDEMAIRYMPARKSKPMKFAAADDLLAPLETSFAKSLKLWEQAGLLHPVLLRSRVHVTPSKERRTTLFNWREMDPSLTLKNALLAVRAARDPSVYRAATDQPAPKDSQKLLERALLWEPLFDLMNQFGVRDFSEHQPLMRTVKALHLAIGIAPPNANAFKQAIGAWRKREG